MLAFSKLIPDDYAAMKHAKIAIFEDYRELHDTIRSLLEPTSHEVVADAYTRREAFGVIEAMHAGQLAIDAVLLDGNLDNKEHRLFSDATAIYDYMRSLRLLTPIIGISSDPLAEHGIPVPRELDITKAGIPLIEEVLDNLRIPQTQ